MTYGRFRFGLTSRLQVVALLALSPLVLLVSWWTRQEFREANGDHGRFPDELRRALRRSVETA